MSRERRAYARRAVRWAAAIEGAGMPPREVTIRDFCAGGLFLEYAASAVAGAPPPSVITIRFQDPLHDCAREVSGRVARALSTGVGIAFPEPQPAVVTILEAVADSLGTEHSRPVGPRGRLSDEPVALCRDRGGAFIEPLVGDYFSHLADELFERAQGAASNADQAAYLAGLQHVKDRREPLTAAYLAAWDQHLAGLGQQRRGERAQPGEATSPSELSLVDEHDFEDWLLRSEIISRTQALFGKELDILNRRLGAVLGRTLDEDNSPLAPTTVSECLAEAVALDALEHPPRQVLHELFGRVVLQRLGPLYRELSDWLRERGVLPDLEQERPRITPLGGSSQRKAASSPTGTDTTQADSAPPADQPGNPAPASEATHSPAHPTPGMPAAEAVLQAHRELRARRHPGQPKPAEGAPPSPATPTLAPAQIIATLDRIAAAGIGAAAPEGRATSLREQVADGVGAGGLEALAPETRDTIELLDEWFGDVGQNDLNTGFLRDWSGELALLALRIQLQSGGFLRDQPQPIHDLINQLDRAGLALATLRPQERNALKEQLDRMLGDALAEAPARPEAIAEAAGRIDELITQPLRGRAANMQKVLQQCEGTQKLERARRHVNEELDNRLARREVPRLLVEFIDKGWRNLLILLWLRTGDRGDTWLRGLAVVDRLLVAMGTGNQQPRPIPQPEKVLAFIEKQLTVFARYTPELRHCVAQIHAYVMAVCDDEADARPLPMVLVRRSRSDNAHATDRIAPRWLGQAKLLGLGDWVFFSGADGSPEPLRLQWVSEDKDRFVFVNRSGYKARELSLLELAQLLEAATAGVAEDLDEPLTTRQWQRRIQAMHEEMVHHASHDALTGLLNRTAFLRALEQLSAHAGGGQQWHALIYFSLDDFKIVNSTLGHEGGDELLAAVAARLQTAVRERCAAGEPGQVGRLGGDEFAILLPAVSAGEAEIFAETQRRAIGENRFTRGGHTVSVAACAGVLGFRGNGQSAAALLRDADEACTAAKHAGGNRLHVLRADDRELSELRSSMAQAARVDAALEGGHLQLQCQRIEPLAKGSALFPYYEILLTLGEADGRLLPPQEFIPAAERFGRMPAVDRWVIREVLEWCAANPAVLDSIAGFAINLSGPSLNDDGFAGYVREQLARVGVSGEKICFEVTETAAVQNLARAADLVAEVKALGCQFSLDDFGSGMSSYSYLKNLPVDYLKIDGQFVRRIDEDATDHAMVRSINELGHFLGKRTIAEYVENDRVLAQVREIGLDYVQGFGIHRPLPLAKLEVEAA